MSDVYPMFPLVALTTGRQRNDVRGTMGGANASDFSHIRSEMMGAQLERVLTRIDDANARDPNLEMDDDGSQRPAALLYGRRMSAWMDRLRPDASDELRIAARGQHIQRWEIPRARFPMDRAGYHKWRTTLYGFHADRLEETTDPDSQSLEDAAALVFFEFHAAEFAGRPDMTEEKLIDIIRKTWSKMSTEGQEAARHLSLPEGLRTLLCRVVDAL
jgi:hypothetical protein